MGNARYFDKEAISGITAELKIMFLLNCEFTKAEHLQNSR
jgi:hypothetical protein